MRTCKRARPPQAPTDLLRPRWHPQARERGDYGHGARHRAPMRREAAAPIIQKLARPRPRCLGAVPAGSAAQPRAHWQSTCSAIVLGRSRPHAARLCAVRPPPATASLPSPLPPSMIGSGRGQQTRRRCRRASARPFARCSRRACAAYTVAQCGSSRPGTRSGQSLFPARVVGPPSCGVRRACGFVCILCVF